MKLSAPQRLMRDDGLPARLFLTPEQRAKAWAGRVLTHVPFIATGKTRDESPETAAFRAQVEEERRLKSLAGIARMKTRFAAKAIDYSKMRWDARRAKFVPLEGNKSTGVTDAVQDQKPQDRRDDTRGREHGAGGNRTPKLRGDIRVGNPVDGIDWSRINAACAPIVAKLNDVWDPKYEKLKSGLLVMTVTNRLKGLVKRGGTVKWHS